MPNSLIQGLTTETGNNGHSVSTELNRLSPFPMVTLFGLLSRVSPDKPDREVEVCLGEILTIIGVSKSVKHIVTRNVESEEIKPQRKRYAARRYNPKHYGQLHDALLALFNQSVLIRRKGREASQRWVHILDSFGYKYMRNGKAVDFDNLPPDHDRVNAGADERPVWKLTRQSDRGTRCERPAAVTFRLNKELTEELMGAKWTIRYTIFANKVFELFRALMPNPSAIRLLILVLRQTNTSFQRRLRSMLDDLGFDIKHPKRAIQKLRSTLDQFKKLGVVEKHSIDQGADRVIVAISRTWQNERKE